MRGAKIFLALAARDPDYLKALIAQDQIDSKLKALPKQAEKITNVVFDSGDWSTAANSGAAGEAPIPGSASAAPNEPPSPATLAGWGDFK